MRRSDRLTGKKRPTPSSAASRPPLAAVDPVPASEAPEVSAATAQTAAPSTAAAGSGSPATGHAIARRSILKLAGTATLAAPAATLLAACGGDDSSGVRPVRLGLVTPQSGDLRAYSAADSFVVSHLTDYFKANGGLKVGNTVHPVEIYVRDSQSTFARAARATTQLIYDDQVDIVLCDATSETIVPVADQCEALGVPLISTMAPWESVYYTRGGTLEKPFTWTFHFFGGLTEYFRAYSSMWGQTDLIPRTNNRVGLLVTQNFDGKMFSDVSRAFQQNVRGSFEVIAPRYYTPGAGAGEFLQTAEPGSESLIHSFQDANVQIVVGFMSSTDFQQFEQDADGASPKFFPPIVTLSGPVMFPEDLKTYGSGVSPNLTTEVFWTPKHNFRSYITNESAADLGAAWQKAKQQPPYQQLGASMAIFDVAAQAVAAVSSLDDKAGIAKALRSMTARTMLGTVKFGSSNKSLPPTVATVPLNGGQWKYDPKTFSYSLEVVNNAGDNSVKTTAQLAPITAV